MHVLVNYMHVLVHVYIYALTVDPFSPCGPSAPLSPLSPCSPLGPSAP